MPLFTRNTVTFLTLSLTSVCSLPLPRPTNTSMRIARVDAGSLSTTVTEASIPREGVDADLYPLFDPAVLDDNGVNGDSQSTFS